MASYITLRPVIPSRLPLAVEGSGRAVRMPRVLCEATDSHAWHASLLDVTVHLLRASYLPHQPQHGIVKFIDHPLFQRDDCVVSNMNFFRTNLGTAFRNVAEA
jgi:hypothetical protein